jgi:hypothetical protein
LRRLLEKALALQQSTLGLAQAAQSKDAQPASLLDQSAVGKARCMRLQ